MVDALFESMGWDKEYDDAQNVTYWKDADRLDTVKLICITQTGIYKMDIDGHMEISMDELRAINAKISEKGW